MKRLIIVVEGSTEKMFVTQLLQPYFADLEIYDVRGVVVPTSKYQKGGFVSFEKLVNEVRRILKSDGEQTIVSTMVDFFRAPVFPNLPVNYDQMSDLKKVEVLETTLEKVVECNRFVPYIQLHEFEALLYSSPVGFNTYLPENVSKQLREVCKAYSNPEDINSSPSGAPSKRIESVYPTYNKVLEGNIIALEVGIKKMLACCPRFKAWIDRLVSMMAS